MLPPPSDEPSQAGAAFRFIESDRECFGISRECFGISTLHLTDARLIAEKHILPDVGYDTGAMFLYRIGLTMQIPRDRVIATNIATDGTRTDEKLGVTIRPPKLPINAENKNYLQLLDALDGLNRAPIDAERPYSVLTHHIKSCNLSYERLLYYADHHYNRNTILQLAHTAREGGEVS